MTSNRSPVIEFRIALTSSDFDRIVRFYATGLGIEPSALWVNESDRAMLLEMGRGTLELFDQAHADLVDQIEVGRSVSSAIRFAIQVADVDEAVARLLAHGATLVHEPVVTPWRHKNARLQDPDGLQVTLYQVLDAPPESR
jgi:catechol 2,3-dioxygenase-like lactoylglutathione lyase family enzyme